MTTRDIEVPISKEATLVFERNQTGKQQQKNSEVFEYLVLY